MTKSELITIVDKIRNRCSLEAPSKITYYWNKDNKVVFKIFFDSLYLPEPLRVDEDNIQNNFFVQDIYEYEDDFKILSLNQDEGYIEVLPDNQHFKIVRNYKDINAEEKKEESSLVHLASKRISETVARSKEYLIEGEAPKEDITTGDDFHAPDEKPENHKEKEKEKTDAEIAVIGISLVTSDQGANLLKDVLNKIQKIPHDSNLKVVYTMPKPDEDVGNFVRTDHASMQFFEKNLEGKQLAFLGYKGNTATPTALKGFNIKKVYFMTDTAEKGIQQANIPELLDESLRGELPANMSQSEDTTIKSFSKFKDSANAIVNKFRELIKKEGTVSAEEDKFNERSKKYTEISKSDPQFNLAILFCEDIYGQNAMESDVEFYKSTKEKIQKALETKGVLNREELELDKETYTKIVLDQFAKNMIIATGLFDKHPAYKPDSSSIDPGNLFNNIGNKTEIGNASLKNPEELKGPKENKPKKKKQVYGDYNRDFPVSISIDKNLKENSSFQSLQNMFTKESDTPAEEHKMPENSEEKKKDSDNDETKDKDSKENTNTQKSSETDNIEQSQEEDTSTGED